MLRALMQEHPDRAERLRVHVEALEASIEGQPAFCLQNVRTLFEAAQATIAPQLGVTFGRNGGFPGRMRSVIEKMDFSIADHPEATKIHSTITALLKGIDDTAVALAQLSNIPNMRHGGSLDWGTLERQHAAMLGGLCDTLVSFLFDVAWRRPVVGAAEPDRTCGVVVVRVDRLAQRAGRLPRARRAERGALGLPAGRAGAGAPQCACDAEPGSGAGYD
jgi:hypothetical protein